MRTRRLTIGPLLALAVVAAAVDARASSYDERRAAAVSRCETIPGSRYQSGLLFNPAGYRSYYVRSECVQQAAVRFRDQALCRQVQERRSLLFSSWGYSPGQCRKLVAAGAEEDRRELERARREYLAGHMTLRDFRVELDNNGRDFDFVPVVSGDVPHGYTLRIELAPVDGRSAILLHSDGYWFDETPLRILVRRADVRQRVPDLSPAHRYAVTATMVYGLPGGGPAAEWSDAFVESVFPSRERSQSVTRETVFPGESVSRFRSREGLIRD
jgi:hypothetical protein